ncbi:uncharacterized protein LODBEIA_P04270 [Lodderomyces beijingensis]|uniref:Zn(2)-C6 fungal-type domain-containing protein n=1 Tax=Lodderomyces beijingensis TaxID=1775926 RepID=A0ABP0ZDF3_9ASCO
MAKERRTKPCVNCKKSKVKCVYEGTLPCERCIKTGQESKCQFFTKLPSIRYQDLNRAADTLETQKSPASLANPLPPITAAFAPSQFVPFGTASATANSTNSSAVPSAAAAGPATALVNRNLPQIVMPGAGPDPRDIDQIRPRAMPISMPMSMSMPMPMPPHRATTVATGDVGDNSVWATRMEDRMNAFETKMDSMLDFLKSNVAGGSVDSSGAAGPLPQPQQSSMQQKNSILPIINGHLPESGYSKSESPVLIGSSRWRSNSTSPEAASPVQSGIFHPKRPLSLEDKEFSTPKKQRTEVVSKYPDDFRDGYLSKKEAKSLFKFFDTYISQQLFGFEISRFRVSEIWNTCPVLVCAICTIASIHHPSLSNKSKQLQVYLRDLCSTLFYQNKPKNKSEAFNTIVALVLCSFWLTESQMFTGLAIQIAKEYGLNKSARGNSNREELKLWYLLYVLDGQQSLAFHRDRLVNGQEYVLKHSKELLMSENPSVVTGTPQEVEPQSSKDTSSDFLSNPDSSDERQQQQQQAVSKQHLTDLSLVSQVEYHQALSEAFRGDAWDLLMPSSFGIPSKSNLELDKWMVSWTVVFAPNNYGKPWSSKSTLIYYNFAKMHINSSAVRELAFNPDKGDSFPTIDRIDGVTDANPPKANVQAGKTVAKKKSKKEEQEGGGGNHGEFRSDSDSSDDEDDEDEFVSNEAILSSDSRVLDADVALSAAHTVITLVNSDKDILDNLRYVPVHIHIMLYYAALLLMNPPARSSNTSIEYTLEFYYYKLLDNLKTVNTLRKRIYNNLPIDSNFGTRLTKRLEDLEQEKLYEIKRFVAGMKIGDSKSSMESKINMFTGMGDNIEELFESNDSGGDSSRASTPLAPEKISAWPGSHHGHP